MKFSHQLHVDEIGEHLNSFLAITGSRVWDKRIGELRHQLRDNPFLGEYIAERHGLVLTMDDVQKHREENLRIPSSSEHPSVHRLYAFAVAVSRIYEGITDSGKNRLRGMLEDGLGTDKGLGPLEFEARTASSLMARGFDIDFHDLNTGGGFDFLARKEGAELEIDCKSVSGDLGRKVTQRHVVELFNTVCGNRTARLEIPTSGTFVRVTVKDRLSANKGNLEDIAAGIRAAMTKEGSLVEFTGFSVEKVAFALEGSPFAKESPDEIQMAEVRQFANGKFGAENPHLFVMFRPREYALIVHVQSEQNDKVLTAMFRALRESAKGQFTKTRPGALMIQLTEMSPGQLESLANEQGETVASGTGLQVMSNRLLGRDSCKHIHSVAYWSVPQFQIVRRTEGEIEHTGSMDAGKLYVFSNPNHPLHGDERLRLI